MRVKLNSAEEARYFAPGAEVYVGSMDRWSRFLWYCSRPLHWLGILPRHYVSVVDETRGILTIVKRRFYE